ncbi:MULTISPECIES: thiamine diphosphokinase [unclassified Ensifer]|uniref:thiamine diphosphokinase n=1 Tax=unclassified Ensifer TaxID=2633371 RepID=UPI0008132372|nr:MULTISPECIES: thiamine diphosphokinase [unclassified Ensifer]OCO99743.1 thiamine pyrophosphokinase [Ensifer sp. LC14]OCP04813.1 thiamine pyrophosphokinase [Ensifer sp. LC11]OCP12575.1 thiamine pyrophosphokinase [Ensifer sp. LC13]OCP33003.1 thiamine pyrophosphokinase [Ensifer sp. LC499]
MAQSTFTILLGGALSATDRLTRQLSASRFVAADGGMRHARLLGVVPDVWVGDFDSTEEALLTEFSVVPREPYPAAKAATDGEIAVEAALSRGATNLIFAGALGGTRSDHAFLHLLQAVALAERGFSVLMTSGEEEAYPLLAGTLELDLPKGCLFSVLGLTELTGLSIVNARYPLDEFTLPFGSSRTVSNVAEGPLRFTLKSGRAIVLARPYDLSGA